MGLRPTPRKRASPLDSLPEASSVGAQGPDAERPRAANKDAACGGQPCRAPMAGRRDERQARRAWGSAPHPARGQALLTPYPRHPASGRRAPTPNALEPRTRTQPVGASRADRPWQADATNAKPGHAEARQAWGSAPHPARGRALLTPYPRRPASGHRAPTPNALEPRTRTQPVGASVPSGCQPRGTASYASRAHERKSAL